ncbi:DNA repair protein complementing XP-C cells homolog [Epargyreus clarus]|uniref:DNA repair protein complementing XP-C cells homolog n=1 Tax=Epargyreus clarus TaxID=520877 RepID=UPI003C2DA068
MPTTRKKVIKTVYKDEDDSEAEAGDFSDSGSEAVISQPSSSEDDDVPDVHNSSEDEKKKNKRNKPARKPKFTKNLIAKVSKQSKSNLEDELESVPKEPAFSIKDLTDADKLLPSILNLSESDSSDDEDPRVSSKPTNTVSRLENEENEVETTMEYKDVWSSNLEQSEEIAQRAFLELEQHKTKLEETKQSIQNYTVKNENKRESDVNDLLALGEDVLPSVSSPKLKKRKGKIRNDSDSEMEDWEEVAEGKIIPQQGLQLVVDFPDAACRKKKKLDVEMMMKRKINRVKKEYQVYMHKVHVLCWLGHGNYVSQVLNSQEIMAAALSLIPSKECYPGERVDMKYVEQITAWFKDKLTVKFDKNEGKFRPKAPPLKTLLLQQIKNRVVTSKKYVVFIFVSMLRAVGLQCRIMLNCTTLPIKPPSTELCSLSLKPKANENDKEKEDLKLKGIKKESKKKITKKHTTNKIPQLDGNYDSLSDSDNNIMQVDGNDDAPTQKRKTPVKGKKKVDNGDVEDVSPPKRSRRNLSLNKKTDVGDKDSKTHKADDDDKSIKSKNVTGKVTRKLLSLNRKQADIKKEDDENISKSDEIKKKGISVKNLSLRKTRSSKKDNKVDTEPNNVNFENKIADAPKIIVTNSDTGNISSEFFNNVDPSVSKRDARARKRSHTTNPNEKQNNKKEKETAKPRAKSVPGPALNKSKYFDDNKSDENASKEKKDKPLAKKYKGSEIKEEDAKRVSHKDLVKTKAKPKNDVTSDLVNIIKKRVKEAKEDTKKLTISGKSSKSSDDDSDFLPEMTEQEKEINNKKATAKAGTSRKIDRRVLSTDDEAPSNKMDTWCEIFVEELEQWIAVDVIKGRVHCVNEIYSRATHPVNYVVGWDNSNYLKDLTRRYVPHWNTVTRKQRVDNIWWNTAIKPWVGPRTARDREEDEGLDRMQLDAPLPKSIAEYKNHPLYALKRHLLKFEAIYPPDAATLGFVRGEAVYARECVYVCRSRDTWLKEAKVVRLGEKPYKVVKARPKWDKLSNKLITDKPLEVFGPWQVDDYEPPVAENGIVPRNAYGNVELFKECMLPKGTAHIKLPGLNRVAKKLNIDCAPAMTGFDFNGGWSHPVYDGFVVCKEFEDIIINAWQEDQEEQERKEMEKLEARVYGNWRRLIKGLLIRERLKLKYGFTEPTTSQDIKKKSTGPKYTIKKKF